MVPDEVFCAEQGLLREQFMDGSMDNELDVVLEEQREDWALQGLSSFTKLQTQLGAKAAAANSGAGRPFPQRSCRHDLLPKGPLRLAVIGSCL